MSNNGREEIVTIMHIVISLDTGGLERFVLDLISATSDECRHIIVCLERPGELAVNCPASVEVLSLDLSPGLQFGVVRRIAAITKSRQAGVIHTHNEKAQFYGSLAGLFARVPVVHTKHGKNELDWKTRLRNYLAASFCHTVVAVSYDAAAECVNDEHIPAHKVKTILNGIDTSRFARVIPQGDGKSRLGLAADVQVIGIVARLAPVKDHATLLEACKLLAEAGRNFRLLVVGDGPLRVDLENKAVSLGIGGYVHFTGLRSDIPDLMQAMDLFVLSSISEGISLTLAEAMACELPVVATAVGGNPEVVVDGETGFLVPSGGARAMADRIGQLLEDEQLRLKFGRNGRERAVDRFSLSRAASEYMALYRAVGTKS